MWAPTSLPFSRMQTESSRPASFGQLLEADRGAEPGGAGADDDHVIVPSIRVRSSVPLRRVARKHISTHLPCQFLDHAVNGGEECDRGWGSWNRSASPRRAARLAWWLEAGVDVAVQEEPRDWLKPPRSARRPNRRPAARPNRRPARARKRSPSSSDWLASSAQLPLAGPDRQADPSARARKCAGHAAQRCATRSRMSAPGQPIGGEAWQLAQRMLAAIGISADEAYSASLSCFHAPGRADEPSRSRGLRRDRPPAYPRSPSPSGCSCSATALRRRCSASRCRRRAAMFTRSKACAPSRPSTRAS